MPVTMTYDDDVARSVEKALTAALHAARAYVDPEHRDFARDLAIALDVLGPAIVQEQGRALREAESVPGRPKSAVGQGGPFMDVVEHYGESHASNVTQAIEDRWEAEEDGR